MTSSNETTFLFTCAANGNVRGLRRRLGENNVNSFTSSRGYSLLHQATENCQVACMAFLIEKGADLNKISSTACGYAPIHFASAKGYEECLALLIEHGATLNILSQRKQYDPLVCASSAGHINCMRMLLKNITSILLFDGPFSLYTACQQGFMDIVHLLVNEYEVNVHTRKSTDGSTPLHAAAHSGHADCLLFLLDQGKADIDIARTKDGCTPLYLATSAGRTHIVDLLIQKGADINKARTDNGSTPIFTAAKRGRLDCALLLIATGKLMINAPSIKNNIPMTPIIAAVLHNHCEMVALLLDYNYDIRFNATHDASILHLVAQQGFFDYLAWLPFADTHIKWKNKTLLQLALAKSHTEIARLLQKDKDMMYIASLASLSRASREEATNRRRPWKYDSKQNDINTPEDGESPGQPGRKKQKTNGDLW